MARLNQVGTYLSNLPRRCTAYHANLGRCEGEVTAETNHVEDHWAKGDGGHVVHWTDSVAISRDQYFHEKALRVDAAEEAYMERTQGKGRNALASERQVGGEHYRKFKIQPWDVVDEYDLSFYAGNVLKYLLRAGHKGGGDQALEDLRKCRHYMDKLIEIEEGKEG